MVEYILIIFIYAGVFSNGDNVALLRIPYFKSEADCQTAGKEADKLVKTTKKELRFVCLKQPK